MVDYGRLVMCVANRWREGREEDVEPWIRFFRFKTRSISMALIRLQ
jgi:hypothetical protein